MKPLSDVFPACAFDNGVNRARTYAVLASNVFAHHSRLRKTSDFRNVRFNKDCSVMSFSSARSASVYHVPGVLGRRALVKMFWVNAEAIVTFMKSLKPLFNWSTNRNLERSSMSQNHSATDIDSPISARQVAVAGPLNTSTRSRLRIGRKSLLDRATHIFSHGHFLINISIGGQR